MRLFAITFTCLAVATCAAVAKADDAPERSPELQVLDRFVGTWDIKVTVKSAGEEAVTFDALSFRRWSQGGNFVVFEDPGPEELNLPFTYDPETKTYPGVIMIGLKRGLVTGTWDDDENSMHFAIEYPDGTRYKGTHHFIREDYAEASGRVTNADGNVVELSWQQTRRIETAKASDATVDEIIARHFEAVGGGTAVGKLKTRQRTGMMIISGAPPRKMTFTQKAPDLAHVRYDIPNAGIVTEGFDGKIAWKRDPDKEAQQLADGATRNKRREYFFNRYIDLKSQYRTLAARGRENVQGTQYDVLEGSYEVGPMETIYLDVKTHLIAMVKIGDVTINMSDYRKFDGVQFACSWTVSFGTGEAFLTLTFDEVKHGVEIDDAVFAMPK